MSWILVIHMLNGGQGLIMMPDQESCTVNAAVFSKYKKVVKTECKEVGG